MKKCPYCAEEIQEEAIKCKNIMENSCPTEDIGIDRSNISREDLEEKDKIDSVKKNLETTTFRTADNMKYDETPL